MAFAALLLALPATTAAQVRGFADIGSRTFTAAESFEAILGTSTGVVFGGGADGVFGNGVFGSVRASRFRKSGERVFLFQGERFPLGIPTTVTVTPLEFTGGYRFRQNRRVIPYGGGGIGFHRYDEASEFAADAENVNEVFTGYHLLGGAEVRLTPWVGAAGELQWTTVPGALGDEPTGVASHFDETNLGGVTFRVKVVIGR